MFDTAAPRRNAATLVSVECADEVVVVGGCEPRISCAMLSSPRSWTSISRSSSSVNWMAREVRAFIALRE